MKTFNEIVNEYETAARKRESEMLNEAEAAWDQIESGQIEKTGPTKEQLEELRDAAEYLGNAAIMLEATVAETDLDLDQLENDKSLITTRARRAVQAIEDILGDY